jgi:hypothetical protein
MDMNGDDHSKTSIHISSTLSKTADCSPIVLREKGTVRLVFVPALVDNEKNAQACVRGTFVYQRKKPGGDWQPITEYSLGSLKAGEGYQLELHSEELLTLLRNLRDLYVLYRQEGIPKGRNKFVKIEAGLARLFELGEPDLRLFFESHSENATAILSRLLKWLAASPEAVLRFSNLSPSELPSLTALLGLSSIKAALQFWADNLTNKDEEFWQQALAERAYILSQAYAYPIVVIKGKAYVGGKQFDDKGGKLADFLLAVESTSALLIVEVKTPKTRLLGAEYRQGVYPLSPDLTGAITQALSYQRSLGLDFYHLSANSEGKMLLGHPRCLVIAGNSESEFENDKMRECFELQRERLQGVSVITYDELFSKLRRFVEIVERPNI